MFDEPSRGSNATQYFPVMRAISIRLFRWKIEEKVVVPDSSGSTMIGSSFSSETKIAHTLELYKEFTNISLERTSNFFWSSPVVLDEPAMPSLLHQGWQCQVSISKKDETSSNLTESCDTRFPHGPRNQFACSLDGIK